MSMMVGTNHDATTTTTIMIVIMIIMMMMMMMMMMMTTLYLRATHGPGVRGEASRTKLGPVMGVEGIFNGEGTCLFLPKARAT